MDKQVAPPDDERTLSGSPDSSGGSSSPSSAAGISWAGALVAMSVMVPITIAVPPTLAAFYEGRHVRAGWVLLGIGIILVSIALPAPNLRELGRQLRQFLPGGKR